MPKKKYTKQKNRSNKIKNPNEENFLKIIKELNLCLLLDAENFSIYYRINSHQITVQEKEIKKSLPYLNIGFSVSTKKSLALQGRSTFQEVLGFSRS